MDNKKNKLKKFKEEQKVKSRKEELLNSHIDRSKNFEDKIATIKLKHRVDKTAFILGLKNLMKKK